MLTMEGTFRQVCLAAEQCGHLDFDIRQDMWWNPEGFYCGSAPAADVNFRQLYLKVSPGSSLPSNHSCGCSSPLIAAAAAS